MKNMMNSEKITEEENLGTEFDDEFLEVSKSTNHKIEKDLLKINFFCSRKNIARRIKAQATNCHKNICNTTPDKRMFPNYTKNLSVCSAKYAF